MEISAKPLQKFKIPTRYMGVSEEICSMSSRVLFVHKTYIVYIYIHFVFSLEKARRLTYQMFQET